MRTTGNITDQTNYGSLTEPVTLAEAKAHMRVVSTADDDYITALIHACRVIAESQTRLSLVPKTLKLSLDNWPRERSGASEPWWDGVREGDMSLITGSGAAREIVLPRGPVVSVTSVTVYDDTDAGVLFAATEYYVDKADALRRGRIVLRRGSVWPPVLRVANGIEIVYVVGFGGSGPTLPYQLKQAMLMLCQYAYRNRGDKVDVEAMLGPSGAAHLLADFQDFDV